MTSPLWMKSWRISFIIVWNITGELHSPKNMTVGSDSPWLVRNTAFHSSPSLICTLLNPHQRLSMVKNSASRCRQDNNLPHESFVESSSRARMCYHNHPKSHLYSIM